MLKEIIEANHCVFHQAFANWEDAIFGACEPLIADGVMNKNYVERIIANVKEFGSYIVIIPEVALPHASLGHDGVFKTCIGFMKVEEPVVFDANDESKNARLFFTLAAVDDQQHLSNMTKLCDFLMNDGVIDDLLNAHSVEDLLQIETKYVNNQNI